jgi:hypothetical protein
MEAPHERRREGVLHKDNDLGTQYGEAGKIAGMVMPQSA